MENFSERVSTLIYLRLPFSLSGVFGYWSISVISWRNPINLYITVKLIKFFKSLFNFIWYFQINKENEHLVFLPFFPSQEFQLGRVAFNGANYYIFIFDPICSPVFERQLCLYFTAKTRYSTFVIESGRVLSWQLKTFFKFQQNADTVYELQLFSYKANKFQVSGRKTARVGTLNVS